MAKPAQKNGAKGAKPGAKVKSPGSRGVGRPPRLSREAILAASLALLEKNSLEAFTLARVARELDTVSMALYNYFPSREALLSAVADEICMGFKMPTLRKNQAWQKKLRAWLDAVRDLADQHPVIMHISGVDGQISAGWLRVSSFVSRTLYEEGMRGKDLALNAYLFCSQAIALIMFENAGADFHSSMSLSHLDELGPEEQEFLLQHLRPYHTKLTSDQVLDAGFNQIISALETRLAGNAN